MSKVIVFYTGNKKVSVIYPVWANKSEKETEEQFLERMSEIVPPQMKWSIRIQEDTTLPDDYWDDAWIIGADSVIVEIQKARDIQYNNIVIARDYRLGELDAPEIEAWSKGDEKELAKIRAKKQKLRDLTNNLKNILKEIKDLEKLKAYWPDILKIEELRTKLKLA